MEPNGGPLSNLLTSHHPDLAYIAQLTRKALGADGWFSALRRSFPPPVGLAPGSRALLEILPKLSDGVLITTDPLLPLKGDGLVALNGHLDAPTFILNLTYLLLSYQVFTIHI